MKLMPSAALSLRRFTPAEMKGGKRQGRASSLGWDGPRTRCAIAVRPNSRPGPEKLRSSEGGMKRTTGRGPPAGEVRGERYGGCVCCRQRTRLHRGGVRSVRSVKPNRKNALQHGGFRSYSYVRNHDFRAGDFLRGSFFLTSRS